MREKTKDQELKIKVDRSSVVRRQSLIFNHQSLIVLMLACTLALASFLTLVTPVLAQDEAPPITNDQCLLCHSKPGLTMVLPSNEVLPLTVDPNVLSDSVHGVHADEALNCVDCHNDKAGYPHGDFPAPDYRTWQLQISQTCGNCHEDQVAEQQDSMHARHLAAGRSEAAVCTDCHGSHEVDWANPENGDVDRVAQVDACGSCHSVIADEYWQASHGQSLADGNEDVPTCSTCHPAHHIEDHLSAAVRLTSPELCGQCHADGALMSKYGISTDVFDTYVSDFHGTTVQIFESTHSGEATNKAVCSDCHGTHMILQPTDENSSVMQANLTETCQRCHPDANDSFTASWMGHYRSDWEKFPLVTAVDWFYKLLIPGVLGFLVIFVGMDAGRTWIERSRRRREWRRSRRKQGEEKKQEVNDERE